MRFLSLQQIRESLSSIYLQDEELYKYPIKIYVFYFVTIIFILLAANWISSSGDSLKPNLLVSVFKIMSLHCF